MRVLLEEKSKKEINLEIPRENLKCWKNRCCFMMVNTVPRKIYSMERAMIRDDARDLNGRNLFLDR